MCELCEAIPYHYGELFPGVFLVRSRRQLKNSMMKVGEWGLVFQNQPFVVFKETPLYLDDNEMEDIARSFGEFTRQFEIEIDDLLRLYEKYRDDFVAETNKDESLVFDADNVPLSGIAHDKNLFYIYYHIAKTIKESIPKPEEDDGFIKYQNVIAQDLYYDPKIINYAPVAQPG